jgi:hypothetical protein
MSRLYVYNLENTFICIFEEPVAFSLRIKKYKGN